MDAFPTTQMGHKARKLTTEEVDKLQRDTVLVSEFKRAKLENEAQKNWDLFYKRNATHFFKDRHWSVREFEELLGNESSKDCSAHRVLLEVGCGVGNFIFPLIDQKLNLFIYACDFSQRAVNFIKENSLYDSKTCCAFRCDITKESLNQWIEDNTVDIVSVIFVLSAIHPDSVSAALANIHRVLKPGGIVLFRDYGLYDQAMLRFAPGHKLGENFYVRQDGTRAYYFSEEKVVKLFEQSGFLVESNEYVQRKTVNVKEGIDVPRIFVQGKFRKKS